MLFNTLFKFLALFSICVHSSPIDVAIEEPADAQRIKPSDDPFLNPPAGFESAKPGTILRHRKIQSAATVYGDKAFGAAYQLLYRSTSSIGQPEAVITSVFIPAKNPNLQRHLSYQIATDAPNENCGPSYTLRKSSRQKFLSNSDLLLIKAALAQGWIVSTADYEGPRAAYTSGLQAGYATLDGVRAVLASHAITGIHADSSSVRNALWGYSGGALASEWALELQQSYAPDLKFVGAALGGLTPNISSVLLTINKSVFAGLAVGGIVGLSRAYPNLSTYVHQHLKPSKKDKFFKVRDQCYFKDVEEFFAKDIFNFFDNGRGILTDSLPKSIIEATGIMGKHGVPQTPLYVYKAVRDEISVIADTNALVNKFCAKDVDITYDKNVVGEHVEEGALGAPEALMYLKARMEGEALRPGCHISHVNTTRTIAKKHESILTKEVYKALKKILKSEFHEHI